MRKKIAAANWKMNLTIQEGEQLVNEIMNKQYYMQEHHEVLIGVPFPYLSLLKSKIELNNKINLAAQNLSDKDAGAFTGEVSAKMLKSIEVDYVIIGHSERREYYGDTNEVVTAKINLALANGITPVFCCGESLEIREANNQNDFVIHQLLNGVFHLEEENFKKIIIAYEPIWAIGTGKTAGKEQAQEMHAAIRAAIVTRYNAEIADQTSILYGGSVKADNAKDLFSAPDVDGGLVGGASLKSEEFAAIINALP
jgi:triosephosphate isomerase